MSHPHPGKSSPSLCLILSALLVVGLGSLSDLAAQADNPLEDPMIRITSLPMDLDVNDVMAKVSEDVARGSGINKNMVTYYWQTFDAIYCPGCKGGAEKGILFVDVYAPGFLTDEQIAAVMTSLAASLEKHTGVSQKWVFIHTHIAEEGHTFIQGKVATWEEVKAFDQDDPPPN